MPRKDWMKRLVTFRFNSDGTMLQETQRAWSSADRRGTAEYWERRKNQMALYRDFGDSPHSAQALQGTWRAPTGDVVAVREYHLRRGL